MIKIVKIRSFLVLNLLLACALTRAIPVFAQESGLNLSVAPAALELSTTPGATLHERIRVRNNSTTSTTLKINIAKLSGANNDTGLKLEEVTANDDFTHCVHFDQPSFTAPPGEWSDIPFTITIPDSAAFGYYFAFFIGPDTSSLSGNTILQAAIAVPIALTVQKPGAKAEAHLVSFQPTHGLNEWLPIDFEVGVTNSGNIHIKPRGNIFIQNYRGKEVGLLEVNPSSSNILPESTRTFTSQWDDGFIVREPVTENGVIKHDKAGNVVTHLKIHWDKLPRMRFGKYTANVLLVFDNGQRDVTLEGTTSFWIIPYKLLSGLLIGFVILILLFRRLLKLYVRRQVRRLNKHGR